MFNATLILVKKFNIISSIKFAKKYGRPFFLEYLQLSEENINIIGALINIFEHILIIIIAFLCAKKYIKNAKKTNNPNTIAFILFIIYCLFNIYINDAFKVYNKSLAITNDESNILIISITLTYSGLVYYFDSLKNEKAELLSKLI